MLVPLLSLPLLLLLHFAGSDRGRVRMLFANLHDSLAPAAAVAAAAIQPPARTRLRVLITNSQGIQLPTL